MFRYIFCCLLLLTGYRSFAQSYFTRDGFIEFTSKTSIETIEAKNHQVLGILDLAKHQVAFTVLIKGFLFEKQLMQDHFNEDVMESDQYPKAKFEGSFSSTVNLQASGKQSVPISGNMTIHGITKPISIVAVITPENGKLTTSASFQLKPADFNLKVIGVLKNNIAKIIQVTVKAGLQPMARP